MRILVLSGVLLGVLFAAAVALAILRKRFFRVDDANAGGAIPLHELRSMRARGEISEDEFERLRAATLAGWGVRPKKVDANDAAKTVDREPGSRGERH